MISNLVASNNPFTILFISLFGSGIWVRFGWTILGLHVTLAEVSGWWSSAGGCWWLIGQEGPEWLQSLLLWCVQGGRLGSTGPPFLYNPSCKAVGLLSWPLRALRANVPWDATWEPSASWVPSTLPLCWLTQPSSPWGSRGHSLPISAESMSENLWLFLVCLVRMCVISIFF